MMEEVRMIDGLALEELEAQTLDLLPDREEMTFLDVSPVTQVNVSPQAAIAVGVLGSKAEAANFSLNVNELSRPLG